MNNGYLALVAALHPSTPVLAAGSHVCGHEVGMKGCHAVCCPVCSGPSGDTCWSDFGLLADVPLPLNLRDVVAEAAEDEDHTVMAKLFEILTTELVERDRLALRAEQALRNGDMRHHEALGREFHAKATVLDMLHVSVPA